MCALWMCMAILLVVESTAAATSTATPDLNLRWTNEACVGGQLGLLSTGLWLSFNASDRTGLCFANRVWIEYNSSPPYIQHNCSSLVNMTIEFEQPEHGGGSCHCVGIEFTNPTSTFNLSDGTANETRKVIILWTPDEVTKVPMESNQLNKTLPFDYECSESQTRLSIVFTLYSHKTFCPGSLDNNGTIGDDMEISIRFLSSPSEWIPLAVIQIDKQVVGPTRHGYVIPYVFELDASNNYTVLGNITICNFMLTDSFQLRWLVNSRIDTEALNLPPFDVWSLDDVELSLISECTNSIIINDSFITSNLNNDYWNPSNIRNGRIATSCRIGRFNRALTFGEAVNFNGISFFGYTVSHAALTNIFSLNNVTYDENQFQNCSSEVTESSISTPPSVTTPTPSFTTPDITTPLMQFAALENRVREQVISNSAWEAIFYDTTIYRRLLILFNITSGMKEDLLQTVYILSDILDDVSSDNCNQDIVQITANIGNNIILQSIMAAFSSFTDPSEASVVGLTLLQSIEELVVPCTFPLIFSTNKTIGVEIRQVNLSDDSAIFTSSVFSELEEPVTSIVLPVKEFSMLPVNKTINVLFDVFKNVSEILPKGNNNSSLVSDVVGIALRCGNIVCPTSNISLRQSVVINFHHSSLLANMLIKNNSLHTTCAFLHYLTEKSSILSSGMWSTSGCTKNESLSSNLLTVCECNHLTHFGILLSARPIIPQDPVVVISLRIIGYVGVAISVAAMLLTVIIYLVVKSLHGLRAFIHINLCINLAIAQIIFVAGVDKTSENFVPVHCQVIAVLLNYFFLVSFMWMLMEGVFLYITLVKVFVKSKKPYYVAFTLTSYGLPLLYMGVLTLPVGYKAYNVTQYGYNKACFLNPENHFIWMFIAPAMLIFLANIGFFIMAATIMWRHQKKLTEKKNVKNFASWFKAIASLTIIMGITWIVAVILIETEGLLFLVYIYSILVAFQGLFIFILFVVLSKSVRDSFKKWWKVQVNESDILNKYFGEKLSSQGTGSGNNKDIYLNPAFKKGEANVPAVKPIVNNINSYYKVQMEPTENNNSLPGEHATV